MARGEPQRVSKFELIKRWLSDSWSGAVFSILASYGTAIGIGFWVGSYVTRNEYENKMINLRLDHQTEIQDTKEKAKEQALSELKSQSESIEKIYSIISKSENK